MKLHPLTKAAIGLTAAGAAYVLVQKKKAAAIEATKPVEIHGFVSPGYEPVRHAFAENFSRRREIGAACCVYHKNEKVVDLWGGVRDKATGEPWQEDTIALVYSATKGLAAMTLAVAHSRGGLITMSWSALTGPSSRRMEKRKLRSGNSWLIRLDCLPWTNRSIGS